VTSRQSGHALSGARWAIASGSLHEYPLPWRLKGGKKFQPLKVKRLEKSRKTLTENQPRTEMTASMKQRDSDGDRNFLFPPRRACPPRVGRSAGSFITLLHNTQGTSAQPFVLIEAVFPPGKVAARDLYSNPAKYNSMDLLGISLPYPIFRNRAFLVFRRGHAICSLRNTKLN
jgi:hypothetical protein